MSNEELAMSNDIMNVTMNEVKNLSESADVRLLCYPVDPSRCSGWHTAQKEIASLSFKALLVRMILSATYGSDNSDVYLQIDMENICHFTL